jgi:hypothetical protein
MCPILDGYGVMTAFTFPYTPSCDRVCHQSVLVISTFERGKAGCVGFTTERQPVLRPVVAFSNISFKHR